MTWACRGSNYTACRDVGNLRDGTLSALLDSFMELACVGPYASTFAGITMAECCCTRVREIRTAGIRVVQPKRCVCLHSTGMKCLTDLRIRKAMDQDRCTCSSEDGQQLPSGTSVGISNFGQLTEYGEGITDQRRLITRKRKGHRRPYGKPAAANGQQWKIV